MSALADLERKHDELVDVVEDLDSWRDSMTKSLAKATKHLGRAIQELSQEISAIHRRIDKLEKKP